jgi:hypothetical protein
LQYGELVAQRKDLDVLVHIADRQQPHEGEHVRQRQVGPVAAARSLILAYRTSRSVAAFDNRRPPRMDDVFGTHSVAA